MRALRLEKLRIQATGLPIFAISLLWVVCALQAKESVEASEPLPTQHTDVSPPTPPQRPVDPDALTPQASCDLVMLEAGIVATDIGFLSQLDEQEYLFQKAARPLGFTVARWRRGSHHQTWLVTPPPPLQGAFLLKTVSHDPEHGAPRDSLKREEDAIRLIASSTHPGKAYLPREYLLPPELQKAWKAEGLEFVAQHLVRGARLDGLMLARTDFGDNEQKAIRDSITLALQAVHSVGMQQRDVTERNILVLLDPGTGQVLSASLIDFSQSVVVGKNEMQERAKRDFKRLEEVMLKVAMRNSGTVAPPEPRP